MGVRLNESHLGCPGTFGCSSDNWLRWRPRVEGRLKYQINYFNGGDWRALYETCSSSWREVNSFDSFKSTIQLSLLLAGLTGKKFEVTDIRVEERGTVAQVAYTTKVDGAPIDVEEGE